MMSHETTEQVENLYREYKPLLVSIAYRMLGSMSEAEDAVQDVFAVFSKRSQIDITHPKAYLIKMVTNRALNMMKAAPRTREDYPGIWLPEPVIEINKSDEPQECVLRQEQLGYALLVLLQTCTPSERAVFVLRNSLGYNYTDTASILEKSETACRKIYSRAINKLGQRKLIEDRSGFEATIDQFTQSFTQAIHTGQFETLIHLLASDAVMLSDGGGIVRSALNPIFGRERITAFFTGINNKGSLNGQIRSVRISGQQGLLLLRENKPPFLFALEPSEDGSAIRSIFLVSNPHKLRRIMESDPYI